jgi:hypothetical protein
MAKPVHEIVPLTNRDSEGALELTQAQSRILRKREQSRERQKRFARAQRLKGNVKVTVILPRREAAAMQDVARQMLENPNTQLSLELILRGPGGKFVAIRRRLS